MGWIDKLSGGGAKAVEDSTVTPPPKGGKTFCETISGVSTRAGFKIQQQNESYIKCGIGLPEDRSQLVHLIDSGQVAGERSVSILSLIKELPGNDLPGEVGLGLLEENGKHKIGSFAINTLGGKKFLVLQHNMLLDTLDPEEFKTVVTVLAIVADQWERKLGSEDRF